MRIDLTVLSYAVAAVVVYYAVLFVMSWRRRGDGARAGSPTRPLMVLVVPARNEELVLDDTLSNLTALHYPAGHRVLVVDDGSADRTASIADDWASRDNRVRVVHRMSDEAGKGKSAVLNCAYHAIRRWCQSEEPWLDSRGQRDVVLVIVDADGRLEPTSLQTVAGYFADASVGTVQIGVRIANARDSVLARMQDMEFVGFSWLVQIARDRLGSSGLGGNGQFTRLSALESIGEQPWAPGALTEDLDLGLRLVERGWRTRYCHSTSVSQQGLDSWRPLLRQRTRWIQGHYQCWRHVVPLLRARDVRLVTRLDLVAYLFLVVTVVVVSITVAAGLLATTGLVSVSNGFLSFVPDGYDRRLVSFALSVLPITIFMWAYQRHSQQPFRWFEVPAFAVVFTLYTYVWLVTTLRALTRLAIRRTGWVKTPRVATDTSTSTPTSATQNQPPRLPT